MGIFFFQDSIVIDGNQVVEEEEKDNERKFREELLIAGMEEQLYGKQSQPPTAADAEFKSPIPLSPASPKSSQVFRATSSVTFQLSNSYQCS